MVTTFAREAGFVWESSRSTVGFVWHGRVRRETATDFPGKPVSFVGFADGPVISELAAQGTVYKADPTRLGSSGTAHSRPLASSRTVGFAGKPRPISPGNRSTRPGWPGQAWASMERIRNRSAQRTRRDPDSETSTWSKLQGPGTLPVSRRLTSLLSTSYQNGAPIETARVVSRRPKILFTPS